METAPALPQAVAAVLVRELPAAVTPTAEVHTTGTAPLGAAARRRPERTALLSVAPWV